MTAYHTPSSLDKLIGLQVGPREQAIGLDLADYGEAGYTLDILSTSEPTLNEDGVDPSRRGNAGGGRQQTTA